MLKTAFFVSVLGFVVTGLLAAQVLVERREIMVLPGQNATYMCRVGVPLQYCRIEVPGFSPYNLNKGYSDKNITYYGEGLDAGQCGFTINEVKELNDGDIKCTLGISSEASESTGTMKLIVAKAPEIPKLELNTGTDGLKVGENLIASCVVNYGRPAANLSWYLDDEPISDYGLTMPTVVSINQEKVQSKIQNFTKILKATDNGKHLRCVASHPAYPRGYEETKRLLSIAFPPQPIYEPLDKFGYQIGKEGLINVTIQANPKPQISWSVGGETIREGGTDSTGRIIAEPVIDLERGHYLVNLRIAGVNKQDTDREYLLTAYNNLGEESYKVKISTSPEPEGVDWAETGTIIGVVVAVLFIVLIVSILIFAKVTGRWCFSGERDVRNFGESSDTESADVRPRETKKNISPIKLTSLFKKNKDKVSSEADLEPGRIEAEDSKPPEPENITATDVAAKEGLVYAELDLVRADLKPVVKNDDEKTEYAEIVYTQKTNGKEDDKEPPMK